LRAVSTALCPHQSVSYCGGFLGAPISGKPRCLINGSTGQGIPATPIAVGTHPPFWVSAFE